MCAALKRAGLLKQVPPKVWKKDWVEHCQHAGYGQKVLDYLGRYVFRVAITNSRLEKIDNGQVTFRYRDNRSQQISRVTVPGVEFIRRFLQHVLPRGCAKVRYYGIWSGSSRKQLDQARALLVAPKSTDSVDPASNAPLSEQPALARPPDRCPHCRIGNLIEIEVLHPQREAPP